MIDYAVGTRRVPRSINRQGLEREFDIIPTGTRREQKVLGTVMKFTGVCPSTPNLSTEKGDTRKLNSRGRYRVRIDRISFVNGTHNVRVGERFRCSLKGDKQ